MSISCSPRRILMTADTVGGVWTYAVSLASALVPFGVHFDLATMGEPLSAAQWADVNALPNVCVHESTFKLEWMPDPWADVEKSGNWLLQLEAETRPDVVHLNAGYAHAALPFRAPVFLVGHSCMLSWWQAVKNEPAPPEWNEYARRVKAGLQAAPLLAAPTNALLQALAGHYGPFPNARQMLVLPNACEPGRFPCAPPDEKEPFVFSAGRVWDEAKNVALLDAVAPDLPFLVYVAGDEAEPGRAAAPAKGDPALPSGAVRLGRLSPDALASYLRRAAVYAAPARYEPFGLAILEAAFAGCALVLGDIPSLREVWGHAALYVPPGDTDLWQAALCRLMGDAPFRADLSRRAHSRALALYTPPCMAQNYLSAYETAVSL